MLVQSFLTFRHGLVRLPMTGDELHVVCGSTV